MKRVFKISITISVIAFLFSACTTQKHIVQTTEPISSIDVQPFATPIATTPVLKLREVIQPKPITANKSNFEIAYQILKNMLQGNEPPNFEYAVYISENPYHNNKYTYEQFQQTLEIPLYCVERLIKVNDKSDTMNFDAHVGANGRFKMADMRFLPKEKKELYKKALANWAIFKYLTDTTLIDPFYNEPYTYITKDPFGKNDWTNSQVIHLLTSDEQKGNCFALTALYKILADRLNADAKLCTAPQHIYIQHRDTKGDYYNVELATAGFPDDGTIQALTYTTNDALMNKIALRDYTEKQSIGICMVNLAKSYEHTFNTKDDSFMLKCAETVLQYDSLNLSALLLKQEVLDNSVINYAQKTNNNNLLSLKKDKNIQPTINDLEKHVALLYRLGYRQMPLDMQQIILSGNYPTEFTDKNPSPFTSIDAKDAKTAHYHALFGGMFKEVFIEQPTENYGHFVLDTKTKQLQNIYIKAQENDLIDPVAFAYDFGERMYDARLGKFLSTDPLQKKYPEWSPYAAFADNPILFVDKKGLEPVKELITDISSVIKVMKENKITDINSAIKFFDFDPNKPEEKRQLYTERKGWIDLKHFFASANLVQSGQTPEEVLFLGEMNEVKQTLFKNKEASWFGYEDLQSNLQGVVFGMNFSGLEGDDFYAAFESYFNDVLKVSTIENAPNKDFIVEDQEALEQKQKDGNRVKNYSYTPMFRKGEYKKEKATKYSELLKRYQLNESKKVEEVKM